MTDDKDQTNKPLTEFDYSDPSSELVYHERRERLDRRTREPAIAREKPAPPVTGEGSERRAKKERRRRIDPTTFEKQYSDDEMEFMNAMQRFKEQTGKQFPTYREVIRVIASLGYRREIVPTGSPFDDLEISDDMQPAEMSLAEKN
jgi:hypothetical protein